MTEPAARMDLNEFRDQGYLQEVNRKFFHPLGLAMFAEFDDGGNVTALGVYDGRDDPEGWRFEHLDLLPHAINIAAQETERSHARINALGYWIQPVDPTQENYRTMIESESA